MSPVPWRFWLLGAAVALLLEEGGGSAPSGRSHHLHYFFTGVSEPGQGPPYFSIVGYLDDQQFVRYDSKTRRDLPRVSWIRKVEGDDAQYWDWQTQLSRSWELYFRVSLWTRFNHSQGLHTWQWMHGCELREDGRKGGLSQFGYDGKDFLSLDKETLTWTAADTKAQVTKRKWEADRVWTQGRKTFLEEDCIEWLQKYLDYGKETLLRRETPVVTVTRKMGYSGRETLICRAHGFYPKEIEATWRKDGEVMEQETQRGGTLPSADGTYHAWLSIEVDAKDWDHYRCHVEHDSLLEPLEVTWEEDSSPWPLIGGVLGAVVATVLLVAGLILYIRKRRQGYRATPRPHTLQWIFSCTLSEDGVKGGSSKFSYDGKETLSFDKETLTWTASDAVSEAYKTKWESEPGGTQQSKLYLEDKCISMLLRYLEVGTKAVEKKVVPAVKTTRKAGVGGLETLTCHIHGFYPKEIDATWRKDGEVMEHETVWGNIAAISDGTYYTWLSTEIDVKERNKYLCHVEHDSLLALVSEKPSSGISPWIIVESVLGFILTVALVNLVIINKNAR